MGPASGKGKLAVIQGPEALRGEVAEAANVLARLGLVTAYGHVSARAGESMLITPAADLAGVTASSVIEVPLAVAVLPAGALPAGVPAEAWAHLALYRARPDAAAIARAQPGQHAGRLGDLAAQCRVMGRVMGRVRFPFRTRPWPALRSLNHPGPLPRRPTACLNCMQFLLYAVCW